MLNAYDSKLMLTHEQAATNFKYLTGPFIGEVAAEGRILDVVPQELDSDLWDRFMDFVNQMRLPAMDEAALEAWETSWESEETTEDVTLKPLSEW